MLAIESVTFEDIAVKFTLEGVGFPGSFTKEALRRSNVGNPQETDLFRKFMKRLKY